ncbi:MAG: M48 family metallopeptidase [Candidatus Paceibacterota bacterium]
MENLYTHQSANKRKTFLLFTIFLIVVIGIGFFLSQYYGNSIILYIAVAFSVIMNIVAYWNSDKIVLKMTKAQPADEKEYNELHNIVENLAITAGLPKPKVYIVKEYQPNAFATGRNYEKAVVAVTTGLLDKLDRSELEGVLAHELAHIGNKDMLVSTAAVILAGFLSILADLFLRSMLFGGLRNNNRGGVMMIVGLVAIVLAPIGGLLIQMAVSRQREYLADSTGALLTRYPEGLASALEKISKDPNEMKVAKTSTAHLWISSPFKNKKGIGSRLENLFQTHPPVEERIKRLRSLNI